KGDRTSKSHKSKGPVPFLLGPMMPVKKKSKTRTEFGDFQTPIEVCRRVLKVLADQMTPACVIEPTCGRGNFLVAALDQFPALQTAIGLEINRQYVAAAQAALAQR